MDKIDVGKSLVQNLTNTWNLIAYDGLRFSFRNLNVKSLWFWGFTELYAMKKKNLGKFENFPNSLKFHGNGELGSIG